MTVIMLRPGMSAGCPAGALEIDWHARGVAPSSVTVIVEVLDAPGRPAPAVLPVGDQTLRLTGLPAAVALTARPRNAGTVFPDGVIFDVRLSMGAGQDGSDQMVLAPVDISGTAISTPLTITPTPTGWEVTAVSSGHWVSADTAGATSGAGSDESTTLVQRATWSARRHAGAHSLPPNRLTEFVLAVDGSASMLTHHRSGAVRALLELFLGVNAVCGANQAIAIWGTGWAPARLRTDLTTATLDECDAMVIDDRALTSGTALAPLVTVLPPARSRRTVFVITDDVPPDLDAATIALAARPDVPHLTAWHLLELALGRQDPTARVEPWRDESRPLATLVERGLATTSAITPGNGQGWLAESLSTRDHLDALVGDLCLWRTDTDESGGILP
jgi:hypothetical protein